MKPEVVRYRSSLANGPGVEALEFRELRERGSARHLAAYQRPEFFLFALYTAGQGYHTVDFARFPVEQGTMIVVKSGSVHRFELNESLEGRLLVARPEMVATEHLAPHGWVSPLHWPSRVILSPSLVSEFLLTCSQVNDDATRKAPSALRDALARLRLNTWLLLFQLACDEQSPPAMGASKAQEKVAAFERLLEQNFVRRWAMIDYARELGCSEKTLTRACLACRGLTAKSILDARILLELKRCLVHGDDRLAAIAYDLGFPDPSGMLQFFRRLEGTSPVAFRRSMRERL